jgi:hypothetical protein
MKNGIQEISDELWENPEEKNWKLLSASLKKSGIAYYRTVYNKGKLKNTQDLKKSYAELYDSKAKLVTKVPLFMKKGKEMRGATIYLKGLQINNKK